MKETGPVLEADSWFGGRGRSPFVVWGDHHRVDLVITRR